MNIAWALKSQSYRTKRYRAFAPCARPWSPMTRRISDQRDWQSVRKKTLEQSLRRLQDLVTQFLGSTWKLRLPDCAQLATYANPFSCSSSATLIFRKRHILHSNTPSRAGDQLWLIPERGKGQFPSSN